MDRNITVDWKRPSVTHKCIYKHIANHISLRNKATSLIRKSKVKALRKEISSDQPKISNLWNFMHKYYSATDNTIKAIKLENKILRSSKDIGNKFNEYFANITKEYKVHKDINDYVSSIHYHELKQYLTNKLPQSFEKFEVPHITVEFVEKYLLSMSENKSIGLDLMPPKYLKISGKQLAPLITSIINNMIDHSHFLKIWKSAKVIPVYKSGAKDELTNYRPISILPCLSKIYERHIIDYLQKILDEI